MRSKCKQNHKFTTKEEIEKWSYVLQNDFTCNQARLITSIRYASRMKRLDKDYGLRASILSDESSHHVFNESLTNVPCGFISLNSYKFHKPYLYFFFMSYDVNISLTIKHTEGNYLI